MHRTIRPLIMTAHLMLAGCAVEAVAGEPTIDSSKVDALTGDLVKGRLLKIEGAFFVIEGHDGEQVRVHVDESTKLDRVSVGDKILAYITGKGHVTTLQRAEP